MKVYVSVDMEGIAGIVIKEQVIPGERLYDEGRQLLTREVNVIVESLVAAGVDEVVVKDAHYAGMNLKVEALHPKARYAFGGFPVRDRQVDGVTASYSDVDLISLFERAF